MTVPTSGDQSIRDIVAETLRAHPVSVGYLVGSFARGEAHDRRYRRGCRVRKRSQWVANQTCTRC